MSTKDGDPRPKPTKDGGPAFGWHETIIDPDLPTGITQHAGMSLRDWFAGQALAGLLASALEAADAAWASDAYGLADAMLAEREKDAT